eukprot:1138312-Ditylum_brightwellii.AAC.1
MSPCCTDYSRGSVEQFVETYVCGLDPAQELGITWVKGRNGHVNLNGAHDNQYVILPIWGGWN